MAEHTVAPLRVVGPSSGNGSYDDGGDYGLVDANEDIVFEAFFRVKNGKYAPAQNNARRLAAMWLDCDGISTEALEAGAVERLVEALKTAEAYIRNEHLFMLADVQEGGELDYALNETYGQIVNALAPFENQE